MYSDILIVRDAEAFAENPVAPLKFNAAVTDCALADVPEFDSRIRITRVVPATYVPLPLMVVKLVIASAACAFTLTLKFEPDTALNARTEISSMPDAVALIETGCVGAPLVIVTRKSMYPVPLIVFDADPFVERPVATPKFNDAVTVSAFADVAGSANDTRTTNVVPATNVPLPAV
jgi:hypothetical protein